MLERTNMNSIFAIICERCLCWLGHIRRMDKGLIPKDLLYSELVEGTRPVVKPRLCYKNVCKKDMKTCHINTNIWEACAEDSAICRLLVKQGTKRVKKREERSRHRKESQKEGETTTNSASITVYLQSLHQRLPFNNWSV